MIRRDIWEIGKFGQKYSWEQYWLWQESGVSKALKSELWDGLEW